MGRMRVMRVTWLSSLQVKNLVSEGGFFDGLEVSSNARDCIVGVQSVDIGVTEAVKSS